MIAFSILVLPFHWPDLRLTRPKGALFVVLYVVYIGSLFLPGGP